MSDLYRVIQPNPGDLGRVLDNNILTPNSGNGSPAESEDNSVSDILLPLNAIQNQPPNPFPTQEKTLGARNEYVSNIGKDLVKRYQRRNADNKLKQELIAYQGIIPSFLITKCFNDTINATKCIEDPKFFSYHQLHIGIWAKDKNQKLSALTRTFTEETYIPTPPKRSVELELKNTFGPIDFSAKSAQFYVMQYTKSKENSKQKLAQQLEFLERVSQKFGNAIALQGLQYEKDQIQLKTRSSGLLLHTPDELKYIYDLNPFSNKTHSQYFLLPRPEINPSNYFIRHEETDKLVEFKIPKSKLVIDGHWPSLLDCCVFQMVYAPVEPGIPDDKASTVVKDQTRKGWRKLYQILCQDILDYPLGVEMNYFFSRLKTKHNYRDASKLFGHLSLEQGVRALPNVFLICYLPGRAAIILYPTVFEGIIQPTQEIVQKILTRLQYLFTLYGRRIRPMDLAKLYHHHFRVQLPVESWGFQNILDFISYLNTQLESSDISLLDMDRCEGHIFFFSN